MCIYCKFTELDNSSARSNSAITGRNHRSLTLPGIMISFRKLALFFGALLSAILAAPAPFSPQVVPGKFIITLKSGARPADVASHLSRVRDIHARSISRRGTAGVEKTYHIKDFNAYAGEFDVNTIEVIRRDKSVG